MKKELKYIELISGFNHNGIAWICLVSFSKSGKTIYFDGKAFQSSGSSRNPGNYYDIETGEHYWISGVKKDMSDRHKFGSGKIFVEKSILNDYLKIINKEELPKSRYEICEIQNYIPKERINDLENERYEKFETRANLKHYNPNELTDFEIDTVIENIKNEIEHCQYKKSRKMLKNKLIEFENEKRLRLTIGNKSNLNTGID